MRVMMGPQIENGSKGVIYTFAIPVRVLSSVFNGL
jgi:hypothetical protein